MKDCYFDQSNGTMDIGWFLDSSLFKWIVLPLLIFLARIIDVSLGTLRVIFISRGMKWIAPLVGFFEVLIWLLAIGQIIKNLTNVVCYIAYASGFAMGTFVGIAIVDKLSLGMVLIRIIAKVNADELVEYLSSHDYGVTSIDAQGVMGKVKVLYSIVKQQDLEKVVEIIKKFNPQAFYTIEEVKFASEGIFPARPAWYRRNYLDFIKINRKDE